MTEGLQLKPDIIYHEKDFIFVFGSNLLGIHGTGAALHASRHRGASIKVPEGLSGTSYALPTKKEPYSFMSLNEVKRHVDNFLLFASDNPDKKFQVTRLGCGRAGFKDSDISTLLRDAPTNCYLPGIWLREWNKKLFRIIIAGSRTIKDINLITAYMKHLLKNLPSDATIEIIVGMAPGVDTLGLEFGLKEKLITLGFPAEWGDYYGAAGYIRNTFMAWYGTHAVIFWDGHSKGAKHMNDLAVSNLLTVRLVNIK